MESYENSSYLSYSDTDSEEEDNLPLMISTPPKCNHNVLSVTENRSSDDAGSSETQNSSPNSSTTDAQDSTTNEDESIKDFFRVREGLFSSKRGRDGCLDYLTQVRRNYQVNPADVTEVKAWEIGQVKVGNSNQAEEHVDLKRKIQGYNRQVISESFRIKITKEVSGGNIGPYILSIHQYFLH